ncbi:Innexin inx2 [Halotydeus destructor]|nr:Innexin inx2 [Halotydeus destructor]
MVETDKLIPLLGLRLKFLTKLEVYHIDNWVFSLHYRFTSAIVLMFSLIVTCSQFFGDPILCLKTKSLPEKMVNTFCWVEGTFTVHGPAARGHQGQDGAYPGIRKFVPGKQNGDQVLEHKYYQWVCLTLFIQSCCFYFTRLLWKKWEGNRIKLIVQDLNKVVMKFTERREKEERLVDYLVASRSHNNGYLVKYTICEAINVIHLIAQLKFIDHFLGGQFSTYGLKAMKFLLVEQNSRPDPMARVFPKMSKCTFYKFGPSGDLEKFDNLCLLPLNVINEKVFIFLWYWLLILLIVSTSVMIYRILTMISVRIKRKFVRNFAFLATPTSIKSILEKSQNGDLFLLYLISKNVNAIHFKRILNDYALRIQTESSNYMHLDN